MIRARSERALPNGHIYRYYPNRLRGSTGGEARRSGRRVGLRYDHPAILRYEKSLEKFRSRPAITDGVGLRETADKSGSQCTGRLNDVLPIYVMR